MSEESKLNNKEALRPMNWCDRELRRSDLFIALTNQGESVSLSSLEERGGERRPSARDSPFFGRTLTEKLRRVPQTPSGALLSCDIRVCQSKVKRSRRG